MMRPAIAVAAALGAALATAGTAREELVALRATLAAQRTLGRAAGCAAELNFAKAQKADPALAAEVMYDVAVGQREDRSVAARTLEALLESFPTVQPWAALATYELGKAHAERSSTQPKAIELLEKFLTLNLPDPVRRADATITLGRLCQATSKLPQALAWYRAFPEQFPGFTRQCAEAVAAVGLVLVEQKQPRDAYPVCQRLQAEYPWEMEARRGILFAIAQALRGGEDYEGAVAAYDKLLEELPQNDARRPQAFMGLAMLHLQKGETAKAAEIYRRMATDKAVIPSYRASAYRQLFDIQHRANDHATVIRLAYGILSSQPSSVLQGGNILGELGEALIGEGRVDDALATARAQWQLHYIAAALHGAGSYTHSATTSQDAIFAVVRAVKAKEGNLQAANRFIAFAENGPEGPDGVFGNADDVADPTAAYRLPADPERDKLFGAAAQRFVCEPYELGLLYLCWDKPNDALRCFRRHYLESNDTAKLQRAAALMAAALRAVGWPEVHVEAFFDFQNYGQAGKDGKPNTKDDLKDPILALPK